MAVYDLEEQDQIDDLKAWWQRWGGTISTGVLIAALVIAGVQGWRWYAGNRAQEAAALYGALSDAGRKNDNARARDAITALEDKFAATGYAPRGALLYARMLYDAGDRAGAKPQLQWAMDHGDEDELKAIARYRLAQAQIDERQFDEALATLDAKHPAAFDGLYADLRGDALAAADRNADARAAYQAARGEARPEIAVRAVRAREARRARWPGARRRCCRRRVHGPRESRSAVHRGRTDGSRTRHDRGAECTRARPCRDAECRGAEHCRADHRRNRSRQVMGRALRTLVVAVVASTLAGCANMGSSPITSWIPSIPPPNWDKLFGKSNKPGPLPELKDARNPQLDWQASVGKAASGFAPAVTAQSVFAASKEGTIVRMEAATGRVVWRVNANRTLSAGPGADDDHVVVGTDKGDVLAYDGNGAPTWTAHVSTEIIAPPAIAGAIVVVFAGDGRVFGLAAADGKTLWVHQRTNPALTVRSYTGGAVSRGGLFLGTPGGRLLGLDTQTGAVGYDVGVATPKGATELERIADITSLPLIDERTVCAAAYQGRVACFEVVRGTLLWSRDISSLAGLTGDDTQPLRHRRQGRRACARPHERRIGVEAGCADGAARRRAAAARQRSSSASSTSRATCTCSRAPTAATSADSQTDGSPPTAQPSRRGTSIVWQSDNGNVYSVGRAVVAPRTRAWQCCPPSPSSADPTSASRRSSTG